MQENLRQKSKKRPIKEFLKALAIYSTLTPASYTIVDNLESIFEDVSYKMTLESQEQDSEVLKIALRKAISEGVSQRRLGYIMQLHKRLFDKKTERYSENFLQDKDFLQNLYTELKSTEKSRLDSVLDLAKGSEIKGFNIDETLIQKLFIGIAAQENRFKLNATSRTGAMGFWQLMPSTVIDSVNIKGKKPLHSQQIDLNDLLIVSPKYKSSKNPKGAKEIAQDFYLSSEIAKHQLLVRIPTIIKPSFEKLSKNLNLDTETSNKLFVYLIAQSYNTGPVLVAKAIKSFNSYIYELKEKESKGDLASFRILKIYRGASPEFLFESFVAFASVKFKKEGFGKEASTYVLKVLAGAKAIEEHIRSKS